MLFCVVAIDFSMRKDEREAHIKVVVVTNGIHSHVEIAVLS